MSIFEVTDSNIINIRALRTNNAQRSAIGLISSSTEKTECVLAPEHAAEPIKDIDDIQKISDFLINSGRYRDNMLFIVGINFGLRASDLRMLRFSNLITDSFMFKDSFPVFEKKTRNTRSRKKNRYITINTAVIDAVTLYLEHTPNECLSNYMFRSISNNGSNKNEPITIQAMDRLLKSIAREVGITSKVSTHTLRKTFCYHQMLMSNNDPRKLMLLQKMLNHSSPVQTLDYIGITGEEIERAYKQLNLGSAEHNYLVDSTIVEYEGLVG
jgi:integrase